MQSVSAMPLSGAIARNVKYVNAIFGSLVVPVQCIDVLLAV